MEEERYISKLKRILLFKLVNLYIFVPENVFFKLCKKKWWIPDPTFFHSRGNKGCHRMGTRNRKQLVPLLIILETYVSPNIFIAFSNLNTISHCTKICTDQSTKFHIIHPHHFHKQHLQDHITHDTCFSSNTHCN